jgi:hypothetical protein
LTFNCRTNEGRWLSTKWKMRLLNFFRCRIRAEAARTQKIKTDSFVIKKSIWKLNQMDFS